MTRAQKEALNIISHWGNPKPNNCEISLHTCSNVEEEPPRIASGEWLVFCQLRSQEGKQAWQRYPFHSQFAQYLVIGRHSATREKKKKNVEEDVKKLNQAYD